jgi:AraC-like DNA-binding protein
MGLERTPADGIVPLHFIAADYPGDRGARLCRSILAEVVGEVDVEAEAEADARLCDRGIVCRLPRLRVATCFLAGVATRLGHRGVADAADLVMVRSMEGPLLVRQDGREASAEAGELVFVAAARPFEWRLPAGGRIDCARLPAAALRMAPARIAGVLLRPIPREFPPLQLLVTYGAYLLMRGPHSAQEAEMAQTHFNELLPLVTGYFRGEGGPSARSSRLQAIKADIDAHLSHPELTAQLIGRMHRVTARYVQRLFQEEGSTFSRFVLERRLAAARRMIEADDARPISGIAYEVGFGDLSYFNRAFRRQFGGPPSALRRTSRTAG